MKYIFGILKDKAVTRVLVIMAAQSLTPNTILRFYEVNGKEEHYSAVILKDGSVIETKSPNGAANKTDCTNAKKQYESIDAWRESLPGHPAFENIIVDAKKENEKEKSTKETSTKEKSVKEKSVKAPKKKCNVPSKKAGTTTRYWAIHIHSIMKEANPELLTREDVIDAYNQFVLDIDKYDTIGYSHMPVVHKRYAHGIKLEGNSPSCMTIFHNIRQNGRIRKEIEDEMCAYYRPLYELIKRDVVPYAEKKDYEIQVKESRKQSIKNIQRIKDLELRYTQQYHSAVKCYEENIRYINTAMSKVATDLESVITSFNPTIFE